MKKHLIRQSFLGVNSDDILETCQVGIVGLGGGGSHIVEQLAHIGVGNFVLIDPDRIDKDGTNLNRLVGATLFDVWLRTFKTSISNRVIRLINPRAHIQKFSTKWQRKAEYLRSCTVLFGCVDSFSEREQLEAYARRYSIPYIDIGMDVHKNNSQFYISGQIILSMPANLCLRCLGFITDKNLKEESDRYGKAGDRPQVVWPNGLLASTAIGLFMQLVTPWHVGLPSAVYLEYDGNTHCMFSSSRLKAKKDHVCKHFDSIDGLGDPFWIRAK